MKTAWYKFCYWLGVKTGIRRLEIWAYLNWFRVAGSDGIISFFSFSEDYFRFCKRWKISAKFGK